ncbi:serine/threonine-protein kinase mtor [Anaeramoeba flamelloides]|uniref:non-specific serine/threonine protein kinase n=1 Tax=Anaeramoeba flamelloides TaxID=1746091 RepID=A0ABQ8XY20_9EUKA|nr:serine/threonine-protein kinase mtor [Anaeramoeba flamelloides]
MSDLSFPQLDVHLEQLKSCQMKGIKQGSQELQNYLVSQCRVLTQSQREEFLSKVKTELFTLIKANDTLVKLGGILGYDKLISAGVEDNTKNIARLANYLRNILTIPDRRVIEVTTRVLGNLVKQSSTLSVEFVSQQIERAIEWLDKNKEEMSILAGILTFKHIAQAAPNSVRVHVFEFLQSSWVGVASPSIKIREYTAETIRKCLQLIKNSYGDKIWKNKRKLVLESLYRNARIGLLSKSIVSIHGSMLIIGQLFQCESEFIKDHYSEVCKLIFHHVNSKYSMIINTILQNIAYIAEINIQEFNKHYLLTTIKVFEQELKKDPKDVHEQKNRVNLFNCLGDLILIVKKEIHPYINFIIQSVTNSLNRTKKKKFCLESISCIAKLSRIFQSQLIKYFQETNILGIIFDTGISLYLSNILIEICKYIPEIFEEVQQTMLLFLIENLRVKSNEGKEIFSAFYELGIFQNKDTQPKVNHKYILLISLQIFRTFPFKKINFLEILIEYIFPLLEFENIKIKQESILTCCAILEIYTNKNKTNNHKNKKNYKNKKTCKNKKNSKNRKKKKEKIKKNYLSNNFCFSINEPTSFKIEIKKNKKRVIISNIINSLLILAVTDPEPIIRLTILKSLNESFNIYLCQIESLKMLFTCMDDEIFEIRLISTKILGRLTDLNPGIIIPKLSIKFIQILNILESITNLILREEHLHLLSYLIKYSAKVILPYCESLLEKLLPDLVPTKDESQLKAQISTHVLSSIGELFKIGGNKMDKYVKSILPLIIESLKNHHYPMRRKIALHCLGQVVRSTCYVIKPYKKYPNLLSDLLKIYTNVDQQWDIKREVLLVIGILGALDPKRHKENTNLLRLRSRTKNEQSNNPNINLGNQNNINLKKDNLNNPNNIHHHHHHHLQIMNNKENEELSKQNQFYLLPFLSPNNLLNKSQTEIIENRITFLTNYNSNSNLFNKFRKELNINSMKLNNVSVSPNNSPNTNNIFHNSSLNLMFNSFNNSNEKIDQALESLEINNVLPEFGESLEDSYYPSIGITALSKILNDTKLTSFHGIVVDSIMLIFSNIGEKSIEFLPRVMPIYFRVLRNSNEKLSSFMILKLAILIKIVKHQIKPYLNEIFLIIYEFWNIISLEQIIALIEELFNYLETQFKPYFNYLIPMILEEFGRKSNLQIQILNSLKLFGPCLQNHLHHIIPILMLIFENNKTKLEIKIEILDTLFQLSTKLNFGNYRSIIIHPLIRELNVGNLELRNKIVQLFNRLLIHFGSDFLIFIPRIMKVIEKNKILNKNTFYELASKLLRNEPINYLQEEEFYNINYKNINNKDYSYYNNNNGGSGSSKKSKMFEDDFTKNFSTIKSVKKLEVSGKILKQSWNVDGINTKEKWNLWIKKLSTDLLRNSSAVALRSCNTLAPVYCTLAEQLFNAAFLSCWSEIDQLTKENFELNLDKALSSNIIPENIVYILLNLIEFMEHVGKPLSISYKKLGQISQKVNLYAKALYYFEIEYKKNPNNDILRSLISINNQIQHSESAYGILKYAKNNHQVKIKENWFEEIKRWEDALKGYQKREQKLDNKNSKISNRSHNNNNNNNNKNKNINKNNNEEDNDDDKEEGDDNYNNNYYNNHFNSNSNNNYQNKHSHFNNHNQSNNRINSSDEENYFQLNLGKMRCLRALGEWDKLDKLSKKNWDIANLNQKISMAEFATKCAWHKGDYKLMKKYISVFPKDHIVGEFLRAIFALYQKKFEKALQHTENTRELLSKRTISTLRESYSRAYPDFVGYQQLFEIEEIIEYLQNTEQNFTNDQENKKKLKLYKKSWNKRLLGAQKDMTVWWDMLSIYSIVLPPKENLEIWLKFGKLARKFSNIKLSRKMINTLLKETQNEQKINFNKILYSQLHGNQLKSNRFTYDQSNNVTIFKNNNENMKHLENEIFKDFKFGKNFLTCNPNVIYFYLKNLVRKGKTDLAIKGFKYVTMTMPKYKTKKNKKIRKKLKNLKYFDKQQFKKNKIHLKIDYNNNSQVNFNFLYNSKNKDGYEESDSGIDEFLVGSKEITRLKDKKKKKRKLKEKNWNSHLQAKFYHNYGNLLKKGLFKKSLIKIDCNDDDDDDDGDDDDDENKNKKNKNKNKKDDNDNTNKNTEDDKKSSSRNNNGFKNNNIIDNKLQTILVSFYRAIKYDKYWYRAWVSWARINYDIVNKIEKNEKNQNINQKKIHLIATIKGFFQSIRLRRHDSSIQDTLRILTLWFRYGSYGEVIQTLVNEFKTVSVDIWLQVIPQLIARVNTSQASVRNLLHELLNQIGKIHPQTLVFPLTVASRSILEKIHYYKKYSKLKKKSKHKKTTKCLICNGNGCSSCLFLENFNSLNKNLENMNTNKSNSPKGKNSKNISALNISDKQKSYMNLNLNNDTTGNKISTEKQPGYYLNYNHNLNNAELIKEKIKLHSPVLIKEAEMISMELIRISILWNETWHQAFEDTSRLYFKKKKFYEMLNILQPLHQKLEKGAHTMNEKIFIKKYGQDLNEAWNWCKKFLKTSVKKNLDRAWHFYYIVFRKLTKELHIIHNLKLKEVSHDLQNASDMETSIPGTYNQDHTQNKELIKIKNFSSNLLVIPSKQRPRKLKIYGTDGKTYHFLLKGHEDLRQDERVMQLFGLVNSLLTNNPETSQTQLSIQRYPIVPLSLNSGLIGWVTHADTLHDLIQEFRRSRSIAPNLEYLQLLKDAPDYGKLQPLQKLDSFSHSLQKSEGQDLAQILWLKSQSSEMWLDRRNTYTKSLAVMSMVGYILGLGDRHPSNLMMNKFTGKIVHIDFGDCFEVAMQRQLFPEKIPFRLTRMLVNAMEISGTEGVFTFTCKNVMKVLRDNKESLMTILEAFVYDPLVDWKLGNDLNEGEISTKDYINNNDSNNHIENDYTIVNRMNENDYSVETKQTNDNDNHNHTDGDDYSPENKQTNDPITEKKNSKEPLMNNIDTNKIGNGKEIKTNSKKKNFKANTKINYFKYDNKKKKKNSMQVYRTNSDTLLLKLDDQTFVNFNQDFQINKRAIEVLKTIGKKLTGNDFDPNQTLSYDQQVEKLINQATSHENLSQCYLGWCPFW